MLRADLDPDELRNEFVGAEPFDHVVIDNLLDGDLALRIYDELQECDLSDWIVDSHDDQLMKLAMGDLRRLPPIVAEVLADFNTEEMCSLFSRLSGIDDLQADHEYAGGGVHVSPKGGTVGVHADFNLHPTTGMHRRLNALLYLNPIWKPQWNGQLELWDPSLKGAVQTIEPISNRMVVFRIRDDAFHGVRGPLDCPPEVKRWSLALYYYTKDRPQEEKAPFHWASWQRIASPASAAE